MAFDLNLPQFSGADKAAPSEAATSHGPITQVKPAPEIGYDPLASVSIMEQLRTVAKNASPTPNW